MAKKTKKTTAAGQLYNPSRRPLAVPGVGEIGPCAWAEVDEGVLALRGTQELLRKGVVRYVPCAQETAQEDPQEKTTPPPADQPSTEPGDGGETKTKAVRAKAASGSSAEE